ncbi:Inner membrane ABC transporter permease protein ycjO [Haploplasma axanthum]|uniref:Inner membrane ABC transporter permease protein ycjO n=2 Tax=Haploplasma axanthum TaxID=29552 RepID=A0A449BFL3_HAPAX|nr:Inner membrane ABC transporter permease protein ycjO [Haploplasma axanthum]
MGILLSFTYFNLLESPSFVGFGNYISLFTSDDVFMQQVIPNTVKFAIIVGPIGYMLGFFLAWLLAQIPSKPRTVLALVIYSPSMTAGIAMSVMWKIIFSGDESGYLNAILLNFNLIEQPIQWLTNPQYLMTIMIVVTLWSSMGIGFLAMLAGVLNINQELYEAAYIDGMKNKWQEMFYITIPSMKPQMLFGAVMSLISTFNAGAIGVQLSGQNPTPQNAGQLIVTHIDDYGFIRFDMGYAATVSVVLLVMVYLFSRVATKLFGEKE